jgi:hypothetical protein
MLCGSIAVADDDTDDDDDDDDDDDEAAAAEVEDATSVEPIDDGGGRMTVVSSPTPRAREGRQRRVMTRPSRDTAIRSDERTRRTVK